MPDLSLIITGNTAALPVLRGLLACTRIAFEYSDSLCPFTVEHIYACIGTCKKMSVVV